MEGALPPEGETPEPTGVSEKTIEVDGNNRQRRHAIDFAALRAYFDVPSRSTGAGSRALCITEAGATGRFGGYHLSSVFQPIVCAHTGRVVASEALLRACDSHGNAAAPPEVFRAPRSKKDFIYLDRLCRTMHAVNFGLQARDDVGLFLNVDGRHLLAVGNGEHGSVFEKLVVQCGLIPSRIVLEILESRVEDVAHLAVAVAAWQRRGFKIALDDFGCRYSNFDRLWQLTPDIVKLDRGIIKQATIDSRARRVLPKLIDIVHDLGGQVICEGVETAEERDEAVQAGADLLQGFFFARPHPSLLHGELGTDRFDRPNRQPAPRSAGGRLRSPQSL